MQIIYCIFFFISAPNAMDNGKKDSLDAPFDLFGPLVFKTGLVYILHCITTRPCVFVETRHGVIVETSYALSS